MIPQARQISAHSRQMCRWCSELRAMILMAVLADFRAVEHQPHVLRVGMYAADLEAVAHRHGQAADMAGMACVDAGGHFGVCLMVVHGFFLCGPRRSSLRAKGEVPSARPLPISPLAVANGAFHWRTEGSARTTIDDQQHPMADASPQAGRSLLSCLASREALPD